MDLENEAHPDCFCPECEGDPEAELGAALEMSEDETPTTSDEDFIVSDSEMEEVSQEDAEEDEMELLQESFADLKKAFKLLKRETQILKKELQKQSCLLFEIHKEMKESQSEV